MRIKAGLGGGGGVTLVMLTALDSELNDVDCFVCVNITPSQDNRNKAKIVTATTTKN